MSLERVFTIVEGMREVACADATFGKPQEYEGKVLIPVATISTGFGLGLGQATDGACQEASEESHGTLATEKKQTGEVPASGSGGGGGGGGVRSRPIAVIEVTPAATIVRPIVDESKVLLGGMALVAWIVLWLSLTLQAIFGHEE